MMLIVSVGVGMLLLAGCANPRGVRGSSRKPIQLTEKVIAKSWTIGHYVRVAGHKAERVQGSGLLKVKIAFENVKKKAFWVDIQTIFYDAEGFQLEETNWQPLMLQGKQVTQFEVVSLNNRAANYSVMLRDARDASK